MIEPYELDKEDRKVCGAKHEIYDGLKCDLNFGHEGKHWAYTTMGVLWWGKETLSDEVLDRVNQK